ncbi:hypothetical protein [Rhizobium ruizarguesonis]|uniref:hypothetical protein n=1 Tax=Rhizobium ruizarguesonis TaxID=2081791 RepID=UPI0010317BFF|nr:hypothetical protein [Rhizobium ruizarguesonis]TBD81079.1 hypothetical protein ELH11_14880 [Rhizobium ruizarguesonis]TBE12240.1 hypothetical protein ELH09_14960 [Rhizobium ruizarguesonis]WSH32224.1 hypothetical protein U8P70_16885 [Rhizobium ruizarguesonis]
MKVGYTEFSYGYAFTENLVRSLPTGPVGAPIFPNLVQEAQLGFDVKINQPAAPLFFQFKLPERMKKGTAFEVSNGNCPGLVTPFYRIGLMRSDLSKQHRHLIELEERFPSCVFYAAPCLADIHAFNRSYGLGRVFRDSAFFSPREIGPLPDNKQHTLAYRRDLAHAFFCSEPQAMRKWSFDDVIEKIEALLKQKQFSDARAAARNARDQIVELASSGWRRQSAGLADRIRVRVQTVQSTLAPDTEREETITDLLVAREIARVDLGVEMLLAQPS